MSFGPLAVNGQLMVESAVGEVVLIEMRAKFVTLAGRIAIIDWKKGDIRVVERLFCFTPAEYRFSLIDLIIRERG